MNLILAIIQPTKLGAVKEALVKLGIQGMTVTGAKGFGRQKGRPMAFLGLLNMEGKPFTVDFVPKVRIEIVVNDEMTDAVVDTIVRTARTDTVGDGKLFVIPVSRAVRSKNLLLSARHFPNPRGSSLFFLLVEPFSARLLCPCPISSLLKTKYQTSDLLFCCDRG